MTVTATGASGARRRGSDRPATGIDILGDLVVWSHGREVVVRGAVERLLLRYVAMRAGEVVDTGLLLRRLSLTVPSLTERRLRAAVRAVQEVLSPSLSGVIALHRYPGDECLRLDVPPVGTDLLEARRLAVIAHRASADGDPTTAAAAFGRALALWPEPTEPTGPSGPIEELPPDWPEKHALTEERTLLVEQYVAACLDHALPVPQALVTRVAELAERQPERERWHALLMQLYLRGDDHDAAAAVYARATEILARRWGLDPGRELRDLRQQLRLHEDDPVRPTVSLLYVSRHGPTEHELRVRELIDARSGLVVWQVRQVFISVFSGVDTARRAVLAARDILRGLPQEAAPIRLSVTTGPASVLALTNATAPGAVGPVLAGRPLADGRQQFLHAAPGTIVVDELTLDATRRSFRFRPQGGGQSVLVL